MKEYDVYFCHSHDILYILQNEINYCISSFVDDMHNLMPHDCDNSRYPAPAGGYLKNDARICLG